MTKWPNDHICCVLCLFLNKVLLGLRTLCQHGRRQAAPRHIKLRSVCKASWRSDAVLMPRVGVIMEIGHSMWRRQGAQAPITAIVRAIDAILIRGSMAHGELGKTQTDFSEHGLCIRNTDYVFGTRIMFLNTNNANNSNFFDWKYCEALKIRVIRVQKKIISFVFYIFFVFKKNRSFRVLMTWLWCLSYRKARNV